MPINKIMDKNGNVLLDLTVDTIEPSKVLEGYTFHDRTGTARVGTLPANSPEIDYESETIFYDYDGTIVAHMPWQQAQALAALPEAPDHTDDNLTFDGWNYTLAEMQEYSGPLDIGAMYKTTDDYTYIYWDVKSSSNVTISFRYTNSSNSVTETYLDDELIDTYSTSGRKILSITLTPGKHIIKMHSTGTYGWNNDSSGVNGNNGDHSMYVYKIKLSSQVTTLKYIFHSGNYCPLEKINIPSTVSIDRFGYNVSYLKLRFMVFNKIQTTMDTQKPFPSLYGISAVSFSPQYTLNRNSSIGSLLSGGGLSRLIIPTIKWLLGSANDIYVNNPSVKIIVYNTEEPTNGTADLVLNFYANVKDTFNIYTKVISSYKNIGYAGKIYAYYSQNTYVSASTKDDIFTFPSGITHIANTSYFPWNLANNKIVANEELENIGTLYLYPSVHNCYTLDLSNVESVPVLGSNNRVSIIKIIIPQGMYSQYEASTNWSALCAAGMVEEASE